MDISVALSQYFSCRERGEFSITLCHHMRPILPLTSGDSRSLSALNSARLGLALCPSLFRKTTNPQSPKSTGLSPLKISGLNVIMFYIGDNPAKDFVSPRSRGWLTLGACWISPRVHCSPCSVAGSQPDQWLECPSKVIPAIISSSK